MKAFENNFRNEESLMRIETRVIMEKYKDNIFSIAFNVCKNAADADDIVQETLIQYHTSNKQFDSE